MARFLDQQYLVWIRGGLHLSGASLHAISQTSVTVSRVKMTVALAHPPCSVTTSLLKTASKHLEETQDELLVPECHNQERDTVRGHPNSGAIRVIKTRNRR